MEIKKLIKFWRNKRVLIIGNTGFKGSWLTILLNYLGSNIYGYSLNDAKVQIIFKKLKLKNFLIENCLGDINDTFRLRKFIIKVKPQVVINLAAQSLVRKSYLKPIETFQTNLMGAINILNICRDIKTIKSILMITTDKVYENKNKNVRYKETDELGGFDPYSSSKAASEIAIRSFQRSFFNKKNDPLIATARAGNIIGGGDWSSSRLLPDIIKSYFKKNILAIRFPNSIRPWQHVLEPIYGYLILSQKLFEKNYSYSGSWNFGPNPSNFLTVKELLKKINLYQRLNIKWKKINNNQFHEASLLMLNNDKAKKNLKWRPVLTVKEMIDFTIDWYKNMNKKNNDLLSLTIKQINYFIKKI